MDQSQNTQSAFRLEPVESKKGGAKIWSLTFDLPGEKVNKLSRKVMTEVESLLSRLEAMNKKREIDALVLFSGKLGNFIAGADIEMIQSSKTAREAEELSGNHPEVVGILVI